MAGVVRLHSTAEIEIIVDGPSDCAPVAGESARRALNPQANGYFNQVAEDAKGGRKLSATAKKIQPRRGTVLVLEWHGPSIR